MSKDNRQTNGKSPYRRANRTWRARGPMLVITALILLFAAGAWITVYTDALKTTEPQSAGQTIDPGAAKASRP